MRRFSYLIAFSLFATTLASCDSATGLDEVSLVGRWNGVGALQLTDNGYGITLYVQSDANGTVTGSWISSRSSGTIVAGSVQDGDISFRLSSFPGTDPTFVGQLTDQHRMAGDLEGLDLSGPAVFRRSSVTP